MKRRSFLKSIIGIASATAVPSIVLANTKTPNEFYLNINGIPTPFIETNNKNYVYKRKPVPSVTWRKLNEGALISDREAISGRCR